MLRSEKASHLRLGARKPAGKEGHIMPLSPRIFGLRPWKHHENYQFYSLPNVYEMDRDRAVCDFLMLLASNVDIPNPKSS